MLFSSMTFVFIFLPVVSALYFAVRKNWQNYVLLSASVVFYAWGEPRYLAIMFLTILINYVGAYFIDQSLKPKLRKFWLLLTIILNLGFLFYFKYFNFVIENINALVTTDFDFVKVVMPIGISFYTFQALSYVFDVYRQEVRAEKNIYQVALYICLFPQLVAGPIVKYHDVVGQLEKRTLAPHKVIYGIKRFIIGLAKKMLIANTLGAVADKIFILPAEAVSPEIAWLGAVAYSLQLFYDFAGYSDMAIGLGYVFGFKFSENFNYPYISRSISEFWRRWHISLSSWFKQYVYLSLGGNRNGKIRTSFNLVIVFLLTGLWHGACWTFIFWGLWHGFFIILEKLTGWYKNDGGVVIRCLQHIYCLLVVICGWVMFRADNVADGWRYLENMFGLIKEHHVYYNLIYFIDGKEILAFAVAILSATPVFAKMLILKDKRPLPRLAINAWLIFLFVLSAAAMAAETYNPFIYFRF